MLIAEDEEKLQSMHNTMVEESEKKGFGLNSLKTETMVISQKGINSICSINIHGNPLKHVDKFKYLVTILTSDEESQTEIRSRIGQAKTAFLKMKNILTNKSLSMEVRKRVLSCYIEPILMYGCEAWTINNYIKMSIETTKICVEEEF